MSAQAAHIHLLRAADPARDHVRGGDPVGDGVVSLVLYGDYLCPYCRSLRHVLARLRQAMGDRAAYVFRHFPNERAHPGAEFMSRAAEAAGRQGHFWDMHDALYDHEPSMTKADVLDIARTLGLDMNRFAHDIDSPETRARVAEDLADGRLNGVAGTPTIFIDNVVYDGAWDFYSMLEALEQPVAERVRRTARNFASLPASGGLVLLAGAAAALICVNTPLAPVYQSVMGASFGIDLPRGGLSLTLGEWCSQGLMSIFFLLVGLEIRRELTTGALTERRAAALPILAAMGGVVTPALIYLAINQGPTSVGWSVPTATDIAFALGLLALLGRRAPMSLRVFVAALAVVDDLLSMLILAVVYPKAFEAGWLAAAAMAVALMYGLNRSRVYIGWPYMAAAAVLWFSLYAAGVDAALAGVVLAAFLPTRPAPAAGPLLAQAATALAALETAEKEVRESGDPLRKVEQTPIWAWASRNLSAASERLLSPAERAERGVSPWAAYVVLPLFAFSATGITLTLVPRSPGASHILTGVILGLLVGKPLGVSLASLLAVKTRIAVAPEDVSLRTFLGAACLCGVGDTVALLMADQAFPDHAYASIAKMGVLAGSILAAALGVTIIATGPVSATPASTEKQG